MNHQDDPALLKKITELEKEFLDPFELASDGGDVLPGVAPPEGHDGDS